MTDAEEQLAQAEIKVAQALVELKLLAPDDWERRLGKIVGLIRNVEAV